MMISRSAISDGCYRALIACVILCIAATFWFGAIAFIDGFENDQMAQPFLSALAALLGFGLLTAAETARRRKRLPLTMGISMLASILGCSLLIYMIWFEYDVSPDYRVRERYWKIATALVLFGGGLAHSGAFSLVAVRSTLLLVMKVAVMLCVWLLVAAMLLLFWLEDMLSGGGGMGMFFVFVGVAGFLSLGVAVGTIAVPIAAVSRANREESPIESVQSNVMIAMTCPKCGFKQDLCAGHSRCGSCGAGIFIEVEEPRCACGYLLYQLVGETCPECGRPVPAMNTAGVKGGG